MSEVAGTWVMASGGLLYIVLGEPWVEPLESGGEASDYHDLLERLALDLQGLGCNEGVAESFELFDSRVLGEILFVPSFAGRTHDPSPVSSRLS